MFVYLLVLHSGQSLRTQAIQWTNQNPKKIYLPGDKQGKRPVSEPQQDLLLRLIGWEIGTVSKPIIMRYKSKPIQIRITFDAQVKICSNGLNVTGMVRVRGENEAASECENTKSSGRSWGKKFHPSLVLLLFCSLPPHISKLFASPGRARLLGF